MIYNTRNQSNDTTESQKEKKTTFNAHFERCVFLEKGVVIKKFGFVKVWE